MIDDSQPPSKVLVSYATNLVSDVEQLLCCSKSLNCDFPKNPLRRGGITDEEHFFMGEAQINVLYNPKFGKRIFAGWLVGLLRFLLKMFWPFETP